MSNWHSMAIEQVVKVLDTDPQRGLTEEDVKRRLEKYGANEMKREDAVSPFTLFVNQFKNVLIIILLIAIVPFSRRGRGR